MTLSEKIKHEAQRTCAECQISCIYYCKLLLATKAHQQHYSPNFHHEQSLNSGAEKVDANFSVPISQVPVGKGILGFLITLRDAK
jgi:Ca2+/H+ antiporter